MSDCQYITSGSRQTCGVVEMVEIEESVGLVIGLVLTRYTATSKSVDRDEKVEKKRDMKQPTHLQQQQTRWPEPRQKQSI